MEQPKNRVRFVTAASLFDGHDAAINIMRRVLQSQGAEVIHLGHNRSVAEVVDAAIMEDAQGIGLSSYQGGHLEYFKYMVDLLRQRGRGDIKVYGGGGGVIVPSEIQELHDYGVARIFSPDDGRAMGLDGMIASMIAACDRNPADDVQAALAELEAAMSEGRAVQDLHLARLLSLLEAPEGQPEQAALRSRIAELIEAGGFAEPGRERFVPTVGFTGTGGSGKSSLVDEFCRRVLDQAPGCRVAVISVDPSRRRTGGALLGDRIRMNSLGLHAGEVNQPLFMRSQATRQAHQATSQALADSIALCRLSGFDLIIAETAGIGQSDSAITELVDYSVYVMTPEYGAASQLEKIDMLDFADAVVLNKYEKRGAEDALREVAKQVQRNRGQFHDDPATMPVFPCIASQFHDLGVNRVFNHVLDALVDRFDAAWAAQAKRLRAGEPERHQLIPSKAVRYLAEIADGARDYRAWSEAQAEQAGRAQHLSASAELVDDPALRADLLARASQARERLDVDVRQQLDDWPKQRARYQEDELVSVVRNKELRNPLFVETLSGTKLPRVALPRFASDVDTTRFLLNEGLPGHFPYTAGVFELKRQGEDPTRMFAGEGTPERTNKRFHYLSSDSAAKRLSTAFDSVTLYGEDPHERPDIYGKIGNSGVSVCTVDDARKLYSGFDLCAPTTSVSMTINGPAPMVLGFFFNAAVDQQIERHLRETGELEAAQQQIAAQWRASGQPLPQYVGDDKPTGDRAYGLGLLGGRSVDLVSPEVYARIQADTLTKVRGTVQADILKEDQAQNTCIFSTEFALRMMGDMQAYFVDHKVRNFYSVSISGYHIAEAGANPITQLALTLSNGFTFVEYYLARGMHIDAFAPNLSFFFSNGIDAEYSVIGRVARRIWAVAMKHRYGASERSQKLKYHIQTSGRSLHAQEIDFNDIRTTLQALYAIYDNCNSLHTNAYDEAITTPTESSVRRALAIQLIINRELGLARNENPTQGAFIIDELTDLVEEAVLCEFERLNDRGGVLGAMERMYQRGKIQEESLFYEALKMNGDLPIIGVNTFLAPDGGDAAPEQIELIRSTEEEKQRQIANLRAWQACHGEAAQQGLDELAEVAKAGGNLFTALMATTQVASLGQISNALYRVGGQYRRSM
ncbi:MAG: methylmalonyl-CoA mutase family protein [Myxococcota bacterium]|nr:methylmalonyl-CoA mutase family protein [Myxococcota bacterium]